ncbi:hypothetical protein EDC04DRAFT_2605871 [Pisolithus marmoratus]|nr:hypothetical protein EDC04DRAFT_2605871 [Pisolithus marmoratus]
MGVDHIHRSIKKKSYQPYWYMERDTIPIHHQPFPLYQPLLAEHALFIREELDFDAIPIHHQVFPSPDDTTEGNIPLERPSIWLRDGDQWLPDIRDRYHHPTLPEYHLYVAEGMEPTWVTRKTRSTYKGRPKNHGVEIPPRNQMMSDSDQTKVNISMWWDDMLCTMFFVSRLAEVTLKITLKNENNGTTVERDKEHAATRDEVTKSVQTKSFPSDILLITILTFLLVLTPGWLSKYMEKTSNFFVRMLDERCQRDIKNSTIGIADKDVMLTDLFLVQTISDSSSGWFVDDMGASAQTNVEQQPVAKNQG